jgi:hypothetical protein
LKKKYDYFQDEFDKETRHEMNEWARLVDRYASELKKYELVCSFCGQHLSDTNINSECLENHAGPSTIQGRGMAQSNVSSSRPGGQPQIVIPQTDRTQLMYYTEDDPPQEAFGNRRHNFGRPSLKGYKQNPFRTQTAGLLKEEVVL